MKKQLVTIIGSGALVASLVITGVSFAKSNDNEIHNGTIKLGNQAEADFPALAKLSFDQAIQKATSQVQGNVLKADLGDENGFLFYDIEVVKADNSIVDVKVDAGSGKVIAMAQDKADKEGNENGDEGDGEHEDREG